MTNTFIAIQANGKVVVMASDDSKSSFQTGLDTGFTYGFKYCMYENPRGARKLRH